MCDTARTSNRRGATIVEVMEDATLYTLPLPANRSSMYESGLADGAACRRQGGTPPLRVRVAIDDVYCSGFRAGYYERGPGPSSVAPAPDAPPVRPRPQLTRV